MKNFAIRAFVLSLAVTGFGAATISSNASTTAKLAKPAPAMSVPPLCAPGDPSHCGLD